MSDRKSIKVVHGALDEVEGGVVILRGSVHHDSLRLLQVADYQREIEPQAKINALIEAFRKGSVPDIELGMRGQNFTTRDGAIYLNDPVFIVDGLQRRTAALLAMERGDIAAPRLGASIYFDTTEEWERERFRILNQVRTKLSPNVLLRNLRNDHMVMATLYGLSKDKSFVLDGRVCWKQRMDRRHLTTALIMLKTVAMLHRRFGAAGSSKIDDLVPAAQKIMDKIGPQIFRDNVRSFFDLIDECWGIKQVVFKEAAHLRATFLWCVAKLCTQHGDFWTSSSRLEVPRHVRQKLAQFNTADPTVRTLAGSSGPSRDHLYNLIVEHVNRGKRTRRLEADVVL